MSKPIHADSDKDTVLKPISGLRGKRPHNLPKGNLVAYVGLQEGFGGKGFTGSNYSHPEVSLRVEFDGTYGPDTIDLVTVRMQRSDRRSRDSKRDDGSNWDTACKGFLCGAANKGLWSTAYAPYVNASIDGKRKLQHTQAGLDLIERASEVVGWESNERVYRQLNKRSDELLTLIAGLQRIGVTVVIRNGRLAKRRVLRTPEYSLAMPMEGYPSNS